MFISWYQGGEVFRSGCAYHRGKGKVFYFAPGHETLPIYHQSEVQRVILNAVRWAKPVKGPYSHTRDANRVDPLEEVVIDA